MPPPLTWSEAQAARLTQLRASGASWDAIAAEMGMSRNACIERARKIGAHVKRQAGDAPPPPERRMPLPAGHPDAWSIIALPGYECPLTTFPDNPRKY